jgi:hypothetical protein
MIPKRNRSNWRVYGLFALAEWTGEESSDSRVAESLGFSPSPALAVDFGDFQVAQKFVDTVY